MKTLIIGYGFTGRSLHKLLPKADIADIKPPNSAIMKFDCNNQDYWNILASYDAVVFTCELSSIEDSSKLASILKSKKIIILSTAKSYKVDKVNELITESSPLNANHRTKSEEAFINTADILCLALIWGYERSPEKWLKSGKITNGNKFVNFIHVDDLCKIITLCLKNKKPAGRILISDGKPEIWQTIADKYSILLPSKECGKESKKLSNKKLLSLLPDNFKFKVP